MKNSEILELSDKELVSKIKEEKTSLLKTKMSHAISPLDNPKKIGGNKKLIARLLTEKRRRDIAKNNNN